MHLHLIIEINNKFIFGKLNSPLNSLKINSLFLSSLILNKIFQKN